MRKASTLRHPDVGEVSIRLPGFKSIKLPHELGPCRKAHLLEAEICSTGRGRGGAGWGRGGGGAVGHGQAQVRSH